MAVPGWPMVWDYLAFGIFVVLTTFAPLWSKAGLTKSKKDYVFASGGVGIFAMIMSITRGTLGVRSFLGYPSELVYRGSAMWETLYGMALSFPIVCFVFVPIYYALGITSVYQYLDLRFKSRAVRCLASATFVWRQVLNLGVTVFTPCVALNAVVGIPHWASIIGICVIAIFFTLLGGLKAAIKADVIQSLTTIGLSALFIIQGTIKADGVKNVVRDNIEGERLQFFTWNPSARVDTLNALIGQLFMSVSIYGCQQTFMQRYCSMPNEKKVRKTLLLNIPAVAVLFSLSWIIGMVIYSVYRYCDPLSAGFINKMDEILPFYVEDQFSYLPGLLGLFLGSLFNGALSFLVSNLNSLATVTWEDFVSQAPAFKNAKDRQQLNIIKAIGVIYAVLIMGISMAVGTLPGVVESSMLVTSATSGPLLGVFLLAMLFPNANRKGAIVGIITSHIITTWIGVGHLLYGNMKNPEYLDLSTEGCTNETFSTTVTRPSRAWLEGTQPIEIIHNSTELRLLNIVPPMQVSDSPVLMLPLYSITYMYYAVIGTMVCVIVGVIVSIIFPTDSDVYDENLIYPPALKLSKLFPGKPRTYLTKDKNIKNGETAKDIENSVEKKYGEMDNAAFERNDFVDVELPTDVKNVIAKTNSRLFEGYDANTRNDFKGDRTFFSRNSDTKLDDSRKEITRF